MLAWKANPATGHLRGIVRDETGAVVDDGAIQVMRQEAPPAGTAGRASVATATDGNGYYGGVDLVPGTYAVTVTPVGQAPFTGCPVTVTTGAVATRDIVIDRQLPSTTMPADPATIWPAEGQSVTVTLNGIATDVGTGIERITFRVIDEYGELEPAIPAVTGAGEATLPWTRTVTLIASRRGGDLDGRTYRIEALVTDAACNSRTYATTVTILHDSRRR